MLNLDKNKHYLLACSYGPDSMALFDMLIKEGYRFSVAHVNYHFRDESNYEESSLKEYCKEKGISIFVYDNKKKIMNNLEAKAREIRYDFFISLTKEYHFDAVLIAQHQDDFIETVIMQKNKKICTKYFGIKEISTFKEVKIIRPLLKYSKQELLDYCKNNSVPFAFDKSNEDLTYERNKIRKNIISKMNKEGKEAFIKEVNKENKEIELLINDLKKNDLHSISYLSSLDDYTFNYAIHLLGEEYSIYNLSYRSVLEMKKIIHSSKPNVSLKFRSFYFVKEYENVYFINTRNPIDYSYILKEPGVLDTPYFYLDFSTDSSNRNVHFEDYPLTVCNAKKNMRIKIKDYEVEARRLFIDWKMPMSLRVRWPIILDKNLNPIYIPRYQKDFKITKELNFYVK